MAQSASTRRPPILPTADAALTVWRALQQLRRHLALIGFAPFQFEGFLHEVGEPATERVLPPPVSEPPDMAVLKPIGSRNGIEILGPPGPPPGH
jgi:hypothetical protein